jgi:acetyltransferase-like isoleucine patch superfamily enzyme
MSLRQGAGGRGECVVEGEEGTLGSRQRRLSFALMARILWKSVRNHWLHFWLGQRGIEVGYHVTFQGRLRISGNKLRIGAYSRVSNSYLDGRGGLSIGEKCIILDSAVYTATHDLHAPTYDTVYKPVLIEDYVVVFPKSIILPGVHIGYGGIVGAGSVVRRDVPAMGIVRGNPARVIATREHVHDQVSLPVMVSHYTVPEIVDRVLRGRRSK